MVKHSTLWFVLADGEHARYLTPNAEHSLVAAGAMTSDQAHQRSADLGTDRPGRVHESASPSRHATAPKHDLHAMEKVKFEHAVAAELNEASDKGVFDRLVLVAPAHALEEIRAALSAATQAKIAGTLPKDLVKVPNAELLPHLTEWIHPKPREGW